MLRRRRSAAGQELEAAGRRPGRWRPGPSGRGGWVRPRAGRCRASCPTCRTRRRCRGCRRTAGRPSRRSRRRRSGPRPPRGGRRRTSRRSGRTWRSASRSCRRRRRGSAPAGPRPARAATVSMIWPSTSRVKVRAWIRTASGPSSAVSSRGAAEQEVAGEDRDVVVPAGVGGVGAAAQGGLVHHVVVVERGDVGELHDAGGGVDLVGVGVADRPRRRAAPAAVGSACHRPSSGGSRPPRRTAHAPGSGRPASPRCAPSARPAAARERRRRRALQGASRSPDEFSRNRREVEHRPRQHAEDEGDRRARRRSSSRSAPTGTPRSDRRRRARRST